MEPSANLSGIYTYNVDQKGRIVMPNRFLHEIGNPFVLGGHPNGYLVAAASPDQIKDKTSIRGYVECQIKDRTGRFVIPSALREYAELAGNGEATVVGVGDEVEIWNKRKWESVTRLGNTQTRPTADDPMMGGPSAPRIRRPEPSVGNSYNSFVSQGGFGAPSQSPFHNNAQRGSQNAPPFAHQYTPRSQYMPERAGVQQKSIYGQPYIEVEGSLSMMETDKVLARLDSSIRTRPRTIFLDLRKVDTVDASFLIAMEPTTYQLAAVGGRLAVLTERQDVAALIHRLCGSPQLRVFPDLESALWWLVDEGFA